MNNGFFYFQFIKFNQRIDMNTTEERLGYFCWYLVLGLSIALLLSNLFLYFNN